MNLVDSEQSRIEGIILFDNYDGFLMSVFSDRHSHEQHDKRKMITVKTASCAELNPGYTVQHIHP